MLSSATLYRKGMQPESYMDSEEHWPPDYKQLQSLIGKVKSIASQPMSEIKQCQRPTQVLLSGTHHLHTARPASRLGVPQPATGMRQAWDDWALARHWRYACCAPQGLLVVLQGEQAGCHCSPADAVSMDPGCHCLPAAARSLGQAHACQGRVALQGVGQPDGLPQLERLQSLHRVERLGRRR